MGEQLEMRESMGDWPMGPWRACEPGLRQVGLGATVDAILALLHEDHRLQRVVQVTLFDEPAGLLRAERQFRLVVS